LSCFIEAPFTPRCAAADVIHLTISISSPYVIDLRDFDVLCMMRARVSVDLLSASQALLR
jgi:hypothetical protein